MTKSAELLKQVDTYTEYICKLFELLIQEEDPAKRKLLTDAMKKLAQERAVIGIDAQIFWEQEKQLENCA